ncbi:MAG: cellulase family glycosylhydrolase [Lachnospiraceae bacterium]|nr:cellulase family glycosylhydrolase [Lachnospiraceae bacterium]
MFFRKNGIRRTVGILLLAGLLFLSFIAVSSVPVKASGQDIRTARPSADGALHVEGTQLVNEKGEAVVLRGLSTHGLTWYPKYINDSLFRQISEEWNCNFIRLAMYSELYCGNEKEESLSLMQKGIECAVGADMYVLADWHILNDSDPNENIEEAAAFFDLISRQYNDIPNILYEICNEPNGDTTWEDICRYSETIIPVIRANDPDAVIIVGTPDYDRILMVAANKPLPYDNIMYTCHFYAASHYDALFSELSAAAALKIPVFITECGISEASGDGSIDYENAAVWFTYLNEHKMSYAVWSLSNKPEASAMIKPWSSSYERLEDDDLTQTGLWVRDLVGGTDPSDIRIPERKGSRLSESSAGALLLSAGSDGINAIRKWPVIALCSFLLAGGGLIAVIASFYIRNRNKKILTYDDIVRNEEAVPAFTLLSRRLILLLSSALSLIYLFWRIVFSIPLKYGVLAVTVNIILLLVELLGFFETLIHYENMLDMKDHPLPHIPDEAWPDVDIFIATYNEPEDLLRRTINGCVHLRYPDRDKVHIWVCDDNRRSSMRALAKEMGVGYFDRPDNKGSKAGNLNHAMQYTSAPYIVTFDADMIPQSDFLLKTIPYFVDVELKNENIPENERVSLGLLQTPQCFYDPDVFQHALYSERRAPNEQDFFYRTIEKAKTSTNSVIYGGSNTVLSRRALEAAGGFYTESITEDFATGLLIESAGFVSLAISEPLASGRTPHTFKEHIQQRTRWGRGVIVTAKKLGILRRRELTLQQKLSYLSSVVYWYSPVKNLIYMLSPLMFAVFGIPVFRCTWPELAVFWLPMFIMQDVSLRIVSRNTVSTKWSGIYETSIMPHLLIPVIKETLGISLSSFKVTDKTARNVKRKKDMRSLTPFMILAILCSAGLIRTVFLIRDIGSAGLLVLIFWLVRNLYYLLMAMFLVDGRDSDAEPVHVYDAEAAVVNRSTDGSVFEGITTHLTEHSISVFLDEGETLKTGDAVMITVGSGETAARMDGVVTGVRRTSSGGQGVHTIEILDYRNMYETYLQILYDRVPTLPQNLNRDLGIIAHLWVNIARRLADTGS